VRAGPEAGVIVSVTVSVASGRHSMTLSASARHTLPLCDTSTCQMVGLRGTTPAFRTAPMRARRGAVMVVMHDARRRAVVVVLDVIMMHVAMAMAVVAVTPVVAAIGERRRGDGEGGGSQNKLLEHLRLLSG
jgi:hypothetical protein